MKACISIDRNVNIAYFALGNVFVHAPLEERDLSSMSYAEFEHAKKICNFELHAFNES